MTMDFSHILGNEQIKGYLQRMVESGRVGHSLLFAGPEGIGKGLFAQELASTLLCSSGDVEKHQYKLNAGTHPDLHIYRPQGKLAMHSIDSLRQLGDQVYMPPTEAPYKVFIVHDADRMLSASANALLKTFEEPAPRTLIILLASNPQLLLTTIISRCRKLHFSPIPAEMLSTFLQESQSCDATTADQVAALAQGSIGRALRLLEKGGSPIRQTILQLLARGRLGAYGELSHFLNALDEHCNDIKDALSAEVSQAILPEGADSLTATQRDALQKEVDGAVTLRFREEVDALLGVILGWYRDLHLLKERGASTLLRHPDAIAELTQVAESAQLPSLEEVLQVVADTQLNIARSSPVRSCFESLFLRLGLL